MANRLTFAMIIISLMIFAYEKKKKKGWLETQLLAYNLFLTQAKTW